MCALFFVRSVSACTLVPEVRLFPSPPALFWSLAPRLCPLLDPYSIPFDVDSGHERHSGELPLFEGYDVGSFISHLICMFTGLSS